MAFYQDLQNAIRSIHKADKIILLWDFNARVGNEYNTWNALGRYGFGRYGFGRYGFGRYGFGSMNSLHLLQLCTKFELVICNSLFQQKYVRKVTWIHPKSKHGHIILDYIITRKRDIQDMCTVRVMRGAECGTDHKLVRGMKKIRIKRKTRATHCFFYKKHFYKKHEAEITGPVYC